MFVEELEKIYQSESNADQIVKDSKTESAKIMENAKVEADSVSRSYTDEGKAEADKQYEEYMQEIEASATRMLEEAGANRQKAIDLIAERIVSNSVNN